MATNGMSDWAVDLADVGAVYPFQGTEGILYIVALVFWIGFHVIQLRQEAEEIERETNADRDGSHTRDAIKRF
ncbi:hypothetical protein ACTL6U_10780 [Rhodovibrionaceae bacterium A322]